MIEMKSYKMLLVLLPVLMAISVVDGIDIGINCGMSGSGHGTSYGGNINVGNGVDLDGHFSFQGDNLAGNCEYKGSGKLKVEETKSNVAGDSVTLVAYGQLLPGNSYGSSWSDPTNPDYFTGTQRLIGTGSDIYCQAQAHDRDCLFGSSVSAGVDDGSIDILQSATAREKNANSWQVINSARGENIELIAESSDKYGDNTNSFVTVDHGFLNNYNSQAEGAILTGKQGNKYIDVYAIHGAFNVVDNEVNPIGSIAGETIQSKGSATNSQGSTASYFDNIIDGSITGRFDWGTEVKQELMQGKPSDDAWAIAAPLESPAAWGGFPGKIDVFASEISSSSEASNGIYNEANDANVKVKNWKSGYGFAAPSTVGLDPSI